MTKPEIAMVGAYPVWDMDAIDATYTAYRLWEAVDRDAFIDRINANVRAIATRGELGASADLMRRFPKLEIVSCYGVGTDAIDLSYARTHGIKVTNTPDVLTNDVADLGIALMLATARQIPQADRFVRDGSWAKGNMSLVTRVCGKKVGIVGMGRIGQAIARRASGFDCEIAYTSRTPKADVAHRYFDTAALLADWAEFLIVIVSGGEGTKDLIDAEVLSALGPDGILINISRGTTVDEAALLDALEHGRIRGAGLDVFRNEPKIDARFLTLPNVVLHPHHGSGTVETRQAMGKLVRDNLAAHFSGKELLTPVA